MSCGRARNLRGRLTLRFKMTKNLNYLPKMTEISRLGLIALSIFAASGVLADLIIIVVLVIVRRTGAKLLFGYFDNTSFDEEEL